MRRFGVYSIRTCLVLTGLVAIVLVPVARAYRQSQAVHTVRQSGEVFYEFQVTDRGWSRDQKTELPVLTKLVGMDIVYDVAGVEFYDGTEDTWKTLRAFPELSMVSFEGQFQLTDRHLQYIPKRKLRFLGLSETSISDAGLVELENCHAMRSLFLDSTRISDGLSSLSKLTKLEVLFLGDTAVGDKGLAALSGLPNLRELSLWGTRISDGIPDLSRLRMLEELSLAETRIGDQGLAAMGVLPKLRELNLRDTRVTNTGLKTLQQFPQLEILNLCGTDVDEAGMSCLCQFKMLREVELYEDQLSRAAELAFEKRFPWFEIYTHRRPPE